MDKLIKEDHLTEDMLFRVPKQLSKILGIWPEYSTTRTKIQRTILEVIMILTNCCEFSYIIHHIDSWFENVDWFEIVDTIGTTSIVAVSYGKTISVAVSQTSMVEIVKYLKRRMLDADNHQKSKKFNLLMWKAGFLLSCALLGFGLSTVITYVGLPFIMNIFRLVTGREYIRKLPYFIEYPWPYHTTPGYEIGFSIVSCTSTMCVLKLSAVDGLFITICLYITAEFHAIHIDIKHLISQELGPTEHVIKFTPEQNDKLFKRIKQIISAHSDVIDICNKTAEAFTPIIIGHFLSAAFMICFTSIALIVAPPANAPTFVFFLATLLSQLFVYCAGGTSIVESSTKIANTAYLTDWYKMDVRIQKMLSFIIVRSQIGSGIRVPFFEASFPTFLTIISTAGSYITLLKTFLTN